MNPRVGRIFPRRTLRAIGRFTDARGLRHAVDAVAEAVVGHVAEGPDRQRCADGPDPRRQQRSALGSRKARRAVPASGQLPRPRRSRRRPPRSRRHRPGGRPRSGRRPPRRARRLPRSRHRPGSAKRSPIRPAARPPRQSRGRRAWPRRRDPSSPERPVRTSEGVDVPGHGISQRIAVGDVAVAPCASIVTPSFPRKRSQRTRVSLEVVRRSPSTRGAPVG